ncbi:hypothetical protein NM688_g771 [Phlebia brevispora]|uniref:Uncharacterized protein n=1 Tax=Phlebia brevispora TaxID=194682 RepID=A0ACC1TDM3_9APHY|nr:hypothetical protein NM688_g771 [Phlebia brevispora]
MAAREKHISKLCGDDKTTYQRACELLKQVDLACRQGSGHSIPADCKTSVAPICALIASEQLNNTLVKERDARTAACVVEKTFYQALHIIRTALDDLYRKQRLQRRKHFYSKIMKDFNVARGDVLGSQMEHAEQELVQSGELKSKRRNKKQYEEEEDVIRVSVFFWVCTKCGKALNMKKRNISAQALSQRYNVEVRDIDDISKMLDNLCREVGEGIAEVIRKLEATKSGGTSAPPSPTKPRQPSASSPAKAHKSSPTKLTSPIKSAMRGKNHASPAKPRTPTQKRNIAFLDFDTEPDETPSKPHKKRRLVDATPRDEADGFAAFHEALTTPRKPAVPAIPRHPAASPSHVTPNGYESSAASDGGIEVEEDEDAEAEPIQSEDGLQSDHQMSEMEVESYVETLVPLNDTDEEPAAELEPQAAVTGIELLPQTPRRKDRLVQFPSTPRTLRQEPITPIRTSVHKGSPLKATPTSRRKSKTPTARLPSGEEGQVEEPMPRRRCRPILLSHRQWTAHDSQVEKQTQLAEGWKTKLVEQYGYPPALDKLRLLAIQA